MNRNPALLCITVLILGITWKLVPADTPPVYDGVCVANPYQYLSPPPGKPTTAPTSGTHTVNAIGGQIPATFVQTGEFPPQAQFAPGNGSLVLPAGATSVTIHIDPVSPPAAQPSGGVVDGNVYRFSAVANNGATVSVNPSISMSITLRTATATGMNEKIEYFDGTTWRDFATSPNGCAYFFTANVNTLGEFALIAAGAASPAPSPLPPAPQSSGLPIWIPIVISVAFLALLLVALRGRSRPKPKRRQKH